MHSPREGGLGPGASWAESSMLLKDSCFSQTHHQKNFLGFCLFCFYLCLLVYVWYSSSKKFTLLPQPSSFLPPSPHFFKWERNSFEETITGCVEIGLLSTSWGQKSFAFSVSYSFMGSWRRVPRVVTDYPGYGLPLVVHLLRTWWCALLCFFCLSGWRSVSSVKAHERVISGSASLYIALILYEQVFALFCWRQSLLFSYVIRCYSIIFLFTVAFT